MHRYKSWTIRWTSSITVILHIWYGVLDQTRNNSKSKLKKTHMLDLLARLGSDGIMLLISFFLSHSAPVTAKLGPSASSNEHEQEHRDHGNIKSMGPQSLELD